MRIGQGSDLHRLEPQVNGGIYLAGILVPCDFRCLAHSDGDVLLHACTDAVLGAVGAGDIGRLFPDNAEENRDRNSREFLQEALNIARKKGFVPVNIDSTIHLQIPKLAPLMNEFKNSLAEICGLALNCVNIKAKTGEKIGSIGESKAISAEAVILMKSI